MEDTGDLNRPRPVLEPARHGRKEPDHARGYARLRDELHNLRTVEPRGGQAIATAREHGDLKEKPSTTRPATASRSSRPREGPRGQTRPRRGHRPEQDRGQAWLGRVTLSNDADEEVTYRLVGAGSRRREGRHPITAPPAVRCSAGARRRSEDRTPGGGPFERSTSSSSDPMTRRGPRARPAAPPAPGAWLAPARAPGWCPGVPRPLTPASATTSQRVPGDASSAGVRSASSEARVPESRRTDWDLGGRWRARKADHCARGRGLARLRPVRPHEGPRRAGSRRRRPGADGAIRRSAPGVGPARRASRRRGVLDLVWAAPARFDDLAIRRACRGLGAPPGWGARRGRRQEREPRAHPQRGSACARRRGRSARHGRRVVVLSPSVAPTKPGARVLVVGDRLAGPIRPDVWPDEPARRVVVVPAARGERIYPCKAVRAAVTAPRPIGPSRFAATAGSSG